MPAPHPPEFRRRAVDLARQPGASVARIAKEMGSASRAAPLEAQGDIDAGRREGLSTAEREELTRLRRTVGWRWRSRF
jgi:transposase-like protein